ncbi:MAG: DUF4197 domain-containing protein [Sterolibacterium sp.]|nr:DUF4197 domain-containing protein [Sterolibacterium sp.]MBP9799480.1 DUF4197 domain-containing protein [Sterolibacterium sp.]
MLKFPRIFLALCILLLAASAHALPLENLSSKEAQGGLKEALTQGAQKAVGMLGRPDGFLNNPQVKIPLPEGLSKVESLLRKLGMGKQADELILAMNRAAEAAVPEARGLLVNAVKQMTVEDVKGILTGGNDAATQYFRRATAEPLAVRFKPIVQKAIAKVRVAEKYDEFVTRGAKLGILKEDEHLDAYVTQKTLDGLYTMIAEEERAIRQNPADAAGRLAKKVFGLLKSD